MSASYEQPAEFCNPPSGYSFRRGTFQELQRYNTTVSLWLALLIWIYVPIGVVSIRAALEAGLQVWNSRCQAYLYEYGSCPQQPGWEDWQAILLTMWQQILLPMSLGVLPFIVVIGIHFILSWSLSHEYPNRVVWVAQYEDQIVGWALLEQRENYTVLAGINIEPNHQWQGVGSWLLWHCLNDVLVTPVYLICLPQLQPFYRRIGFVAVPRRDMPRELRHSILEGMGLFRVPTQPANHSPATPPLPPGFSMRVLQNVGESWQIYKTFWRRTRFRHSRLYILALIALVLIGTFLVASGIIWSLKAMGFAWLEYFNVTLLGVRISGLAIALSLMVFLVGFLRVFAGWQEWLVERSNRPIGYIHLSSRVSCSVLYNLHVEPEYLQQNILQLAIARLSRRIALPLYVTCSRRDVRLYTRLGFTSASRRNLPFELRILQLSYVLKLTRTAATNLSSQLAHSSEPINLNLPSESLPTPASGSDGTSSSHTGTDQRQRGQRWIWIGIAVVILGAYIVAPLFNFESLLNQSQQLAETPKPIGEQIIPPSHRGDASSVAFSPDGQTMVVGNWDNSKIEVWDFRRNALMRRIENDSEGIPVVRLSPNGQTLLAGSKDGTIKIRFNSGNLSANLMAHPKGVLAIALSPDGQRFVSGGEDGTIKIWNLRRGNLLKQIKDAHPGDISGLAISPDGQMFASSSSWDRTIKIWDLQQGTLLETLEGHAKFIEALAISPDGQTLVSSSEGGEIKIWDLKQGTLLKDLANTSDSVSSLAISPDGQKLVGGTYLGKNVKIWDLKTGTLLQSFRGQDWEVRGISPDGQHVVVGRHNVAILDINGNQAPQRLGGDWGIRALAIAPDNQTLISGNQDSTIRIWDLSSKSLWQTLNIPSGEIESLAVSPNNQTLVVGTSTGAVQLLDYKQGTLEKVLSPPHSGKVQALAISSDGQTLFAGSWNDRFVRVWDLRRSQLLGTLNTHAEVLSLAMSPDGQTLYVGTLGAIEIWDVNHQQLRRLFSAHSHEVQMLVASLDGKLLVSGGIDRVDLSQIWTIKVWDTQSLGLLATLKGYSSSLESLAINSDGKTAIFNDCCKASFWNWTNNKLVSDIDGMNHNTVLSPDGKTLVSVGSDRETITVKALDTLLQSSNAQ